MTVFKFFIDWLVMPPATLVAYVIVLPIGLLPLLAGAAAWYGTAFLLDGPNTPPPPRLSTFVVACFVGLYVALVVGMGIYIQLPHVISQLGDD